MLTFATISPSDAYLEAVAREHREQIRAWIIGYYGERCEERCKDCVVCRKWAAFDELFGDI